MELCSIINHGIFQTILDKFYLEDFLIFASVSKSINFAIKNFVKQYNIYFYNWFNKSRLIIENCFEKFNFKTQQTALVKSLVQRQFKVQTLESCKSSKKYYSDSEYPTNDKSLIDLVKTIIEKLDKSHLSCIIKRGKYIYSHKTPEQYSKFWLKDFELNDSKIQKLIEFGLLTRYYFLNENDSSLFVVSCFKPIDELNYYDVSADWEEKFDYFDSKGNLSLTFGQTGAHRFLFTRDLEYHNPHGNGNPIFEYKINIENLKKNFNIENLKKNLNIFILNK